MKPIIPFFPLSAHVLPGGRLQLRIFEPRYVRMVKEACANDTGIGICMFNAKGAKETNEHIFPIGTYAKVVDFDLLPDGMLGITVEGKQCFQILSVETEADGLRVGQIEWLTEWTLPEDQQLLSPINERLVEIFEKYHELKNLYETPHFDDPIWVIYRWLELIPVNAEQKQQLLKDKDCMKALSFLTQLVE
ncbi:MAG: LON peptidase substrate-binding domain-containing protein [Paraglaciecola sp.]|uniref:LON peptidase substrate-binding domain-containing protein n=1 Tax=Paraglaciecola sp. TaxID=1920173 RepID=UPI00273D9A66|nr:LON peptidase substrate-binding domain-containing protein [Paraglaciecola sp.]MDP5032433.1 LON peptidase substrate-binding domain-containing protein [Paraglaciecola sp.]MDP5130661.1 LON peptidase substrate-binding domain-containing protein [Paraglaciecola sp.]